MKKYLVAALLASSAFVAPNAHATFINGGFRAVGESSNLNALPTSNLLAATIQLALGSVFSRSGDFSSVALGAPTSVSDITQLAPTGWTVTAGGFTFTVTALTSPAPTANANVSCSTFGQSESCSQTFNLDIVGSVDDADPTFDPTGFTGSMAISAGCSDTTIDGQCTVGASVNSAWDFRVTAAGTEPPPPPPPPTDVPAPASLALFGAALAGLSLARRRR